MLLDDPVHVVQGKAGQGGIRIIVRLLWFGGWGLGTGDWWPPR